MGISVRTDRWRLTRWMRWNGANLTSHWELPDEGLELYVHAGDDGLSMDGDYESVNVASANPGVVAQLGVLLEREFQPVL